MGISISEATYQKIEKNRREGRLCQGGRSRAGCTSRATIISAQTLWVHEIGVGKPTEAFGVYCSRHAHPAGFRGVNFEVHTAVRITPALAATLRAEAEAKAAASRAEYAARCAS